MPLKVLVSLDSHDILHKMAQNSRERQIEHIDSLPYPEREELCRILDHNDQWEDLAGSYMKFDVRTIQRFRKERSPTSRLLTEWGHKYTTTHLFILLSRMQHYQSLEILKPFVDRKCHVLIKKGEGNLERLFGDLDQENSDSDDMKIDAQNFNKLEPAQANVSKVYVNQMSAIGDKILNGIPEPSTDGVPSNSRNILTPSLPPLNVPSLSKSVAGTAKIKNEPI